MFRTFSIFVCLAVALTVQAAEQIAPGVTLRQDAGLEPQKESRRLLPAVDLRNRTVTDRRYATDCPSKMLPPEIVAERALHSPRALIPRASVLISAVPAYSSRPGAPNTLYLDFNGETITGTAWNADSTFGKPSWQAMPFDKDGDPATFSDIEQDAIFLIWQRVSEDYRTFNINVTTVLPSSFGPNTGHVLITRSTDSAGQACPNGATSGGVAYRDTFGLADYATNWSPAWVYYDNLGPGEESYIADAASHEFGHNLGLTHDGVVPNLPTQNNYYGGHGVTGFDWGTIMGDSYGRTMTQWSKGEYTGANNPQDDIAIIAGKLGTIADDFADTTGLATSLSFVTNGFGRTITAFDGLISSSLDSDVFKFDAIPGAVAITVAPRTVAGNVLSPLTPGADLDVQADILDVNGNVVSGLSSNPQDNFTATINGTLSSAGIYYLRVRGAGNRNPLNDGYSTYGSIGTYRVTGTCPGQWINQAPIVNAGVDGVVVVGVPSALSGTASDDGLPTGSTLTQVWTVVSGPGTVTFADPTALTTTATFSAPGTYVLRLTATDGTLSANDDVTFKANTAPVVSAGPDQTVPLPSLVTLAGTATDDGLPIGSQVAVAWSLVSGPGAVTFSHATQRASTVTVDQEGVYVLRLTATDGELTSSDTMTITVGLDQAFPTSSDEKSCGLGGLTAILLLGVVLLGSRLRQEKSS